MVLAFSITAVPASIPSDHVHILMGSFNGAQWIDAQLDSFLTQSHPHWSLWVSDDGSHDDTRDRVEAFARRNPNRAVRLIEGPRQGSAANFLHLLCHPDLPSGIVALSDQDDVWLPHKLERAVAQLQAAGPIPSAWAARYTVSDEQLNPQRPSSLWPRGPSLGNALVQNILSGHTLTLNSAALEIVRRAGLHRVPHHDWWIYLLLMASGAQVLVDTEVVLIYRQHGKNVLGARSTARARLSRLGALRQGQLHRWVTANMQALAVADLPLTPEARELVKLWPGRGRASQLRLLRDFAVHRQTLTESALIYLAALLGRL